MTDDQIATLLKPKQDWRAIAGVLVGVAGVTWGIVKWAATTPTREEHNQTRDEIVRIRIELPAMTAKVEGVVQSQQRLEKAVDSIGTKLDERKGRVR